MSTQFIADVHLSGEQPHVMRLFLDYLSGPAQEAERLFILGDLFEAWIGDDAVQPEYEPVLEALGRLTGAGTEVNVLHGNRDFLLGMGFEERTGCHIQPDPCIVDLHGTPTALLHGDTLCTDDVPYQQLRDKLRNLAWIEGFLAKPVEERLALARQMRAQSREATGSKAQGIMDVNQQAVEEAFHRHGVERIIHGHTHRPNVHHYHFEGRTLERIVLGDWGERGSVLFCDADGCALTPYPAGE